mgnify:CR=1 FL=1
MRAEVIKKIIPPFFLCTSLLILGCPVFAGYPLGGRAFCNSGFVRKGDYCVDPNSDTVYPLGRTAFCIGGFYRNGQYCVRNGYKL